MSASVVSRRPLGGTDLSVHPLCLGGNVFGWTADQRQSFEVLDAYRDAGGNFVDTADVYSSRASGQTVGGSEQVIGRWCASRGARDRVVLATKVGFLGGLSRGNILDKVDDSLRRLQTDHIDLLYAHYDDRGTPLGETMAGFAEVVSTGRARYIAASNYSPERLSEALDIASANGFPRFVALQTQYNLLERRELRDDRMGTGAFEGPLGEVCCRGEVACVPYWALAKGFLTGKYRSRAGGVTGGDASARADYHQPHEYLDARGSAVLEALDQIAEAQSAPLAAVALSWTAAQAGVIGAVASARTRQQLDELMAMTRVRLTPADRALLEKASG